MLAMDEVRRDGDDELCGHLAARDGRWLAMTVFGAVLSEHASRSNAVAVVLDEGLASLGDRWTLRYPDGTTEIVCILEAQPGVATLALGYYSMPGAPTLRITADQLASGNWAMTR